MSRERFENLDGLRAFACLGIIAMHIKANTDYNITGWFYQTFISSWTLFVYLFLLISGFGMFCGYYERFLLGEINLNDFYSKRYKKIFPFFTFLIILDNVVERSAAHIIEGLTEMTLVFGLLPNNELSTIGVGWTLGVIFLFYMLFPFFVWLCWTKKRAWISFFVSILLNVFCEIYFFSERFVIASYTSRHSFLYCAPFFFCGGVIYLYRNEIKKIVLRYRWVSLSCCLAISLGYFFMRERISEKLTDLLMLVVFIPWLCYAIGAESRILNNPITRYISGISMECYLAHMVIFRVIEKTSCLYLMGDSWCGYLWACILVLVGVLVFVEVWKKMWTLLKKTIRV